VARVTTGEGTCLAQALLSHPPDVVTVALPTGSAPIFTTLQTGTGGESCVVRGERVGASIAWFDYKCQPNCWWESFSCDGRRWSFCRATASDFSGTYQDGRITGIQPVRFQATDGTSGYDVGVELAFTLEIVG
jgi:hypothetical protein